MAHKTIFLKSAREGEPVQKEAKAEATITPGNLIQYHTDGDVKKHATAGGWGGRKFAIEDALQGNEIGDDYSADDQVQFIDCGPGDEVYAWLAQGESVSIGSPLESNGSGLLRVSSGEGSELPGSILAQSLETLDLSTSGDSATRIKVEIL